MQLELLAQALAPNEIVNAAAVDIADLAYDTRAVAPGALFFCVRGSRSDGHDLAADAVARGAAALVVERALDVAVPQLVVADSRRAMAPAAVAFFRDPSRELDVAAVTGTAGKTTTTYLLLRDPARRRPSPRTADEPRAARRRRRAARGAEHARGDRPAAAPPRDGRRRQHVVRDGGDVARVGAGPARRRALRRARLHEPRARAPRLPRDDGGLLRREAPALRAGGARSRQRRRPVGPAPRGRARRSDRRSTPTATRSTRTSSCAAASTSRTLSRQRRRRARSASARTRSATASKPWTAFPDDSSSSTRASRSP